MLYNNMYIKPYYKKYLSLSIEKYHKITVI